MLKMIDVLEQSLVENFRLSLSDTHQQIKFSEQLCQSILNAPVTELHQIISTLDGVFTQTDLKQSLDLNHEFTVLLNSADNLKNEQYLADFTKLVTLCLAYETDSLSQLDIHQPLQDYPV